MCNHEAIQIANELIAIPDGYELSFARKVQHDGEPLMWLRFIKLGQQDRWGGEHFSLTYTPDDKKLKGFMHLDDQFDTDVVPNEDEAKTIALGFLEKYAPDLVDTIEVRWIRPLRKNPISSPHDDPFILASGKIITGMRVKIYINTNNKFGWVISGKNGRVITFERDISWDTVQKCRATERWLHDSWSEVKGCLISPVAA